MRCPNCKNNNPNGFRFCLQCGEDLGEPTIVQRPETITRVRAGLLPDISPKVKPPDSRPRKILVAGAALFTLFLIVFTLIGGYALLVYTGNTIIIGLPPATPEPTRAVESMARKEPPAVRPTATPIPSVATVAGFEQPTYRDETTDASEPVYRVFMPRGSVAIVIEGPRGRQTEVSQTFLLKARAGQTFAATLVPLSSGSPTFVVTENDSQLSGEVRGAWAQTLQTSGDVAIRVCCAVPFRLEVAIK